MKIRSQYHNTEQVSVSAVSCIYLFMYFYGKNKINQSTLWFLCYI